MILGVIFSIGGYFSQRIVINLILRLSTWWNNTLSVGETTLGGHFSSIWWVENQITLEDLALPLIARFGTEVETGEPASK